MGITWHGDGPWGTGKHELLTPSEVDNNFWQLVQDVAAKAVQGVGIANIHVAGSQMTIVLTDHTLLGPYQLPVAQIQFRGEWLPNTAYVKNDIFTHGGTTYIVLLDHVSAMTFDPHANDGHGNDYYGLLLQNPALTLPTGGAVGAFLRKFSTTDFDAAWQTAALGDLSDVFLPDSPIPDTGDVLTFSGGVWIAAPIAALAISLTELIDVNILASPPPNTGDLLTWNGTFWVNEPPAFSPTITTPVPGQILTYDGTHWKNSNTADIPVLAGVSVFGPLTLDYSQGSVQRVTMTNGVTFNGVNNWPPTGQFGRLVLEVRNTGAFTWSWPTAYHWPGGADPVVSPNGRDIFALTTFDGGTSVDGSVIGQNYL